MLYTETTLSRRMRLPVDIDDTTAKLIAAAVLYRGRGGDVWLNGESVNLANIRLKLKAEFQPDSEIQ